MTATAQRRRLPGGVSAEMILLWIGLATVVVAIAAVWVTVQVGHRLSGTYSRSQIPSNPFEVFFGVMSGEVAWPSSGVGVLIGLLSVVLLAAASGAVVRRRLRRSRKRVDRAVRHMGRRDEVDSLSRRQARSTADRFGLSADIAPGVPIGRSVSSGQPLYGSWEDMHVDCWGPRTGKTSSRAIPAILEAPGAVLVTSNKRDVVDATRNVRAGTGPVWVFDPQGICGEEPTWWWNPLTYVTDEVKAARLADHFAAGSRDPGSRADAFFDPAGRDLLAGLLLAAALREYPITEVYAWLTRPTDEMPIEILRAHDFPLTADQVAGVIGAPERQRGGIYGTAQQMASCLTNRQVAEWVTPRSASPGKDHRPELHPTEFVRDGQATLYSLSREGRGTAGPLVTALTVAVVEAAEELAATSAGGRLALPLLGVLDEAANVCRWRDLPDLYSHYGSRGIVLMTILQSWSQGVDVWGESGMKKLWSAANVKVYGGGVAETAFLEDLAKIVGDYDRISSSTSYGKGHRSVSQQLQRERILDVADLAALPKGRALVLGSGARPTLIRTQPWMVGPHAAAIRASIEDHDPQYAATINEAELSLSSVIENEESTVPEESL